MKTINAVHGTPGYLGFRSLDLSGVIRAGIDARDVSAFVAPPRVVKPINAGQMESVQVLPAPAPARHAVPPPRDERSP